MILRSCLSIFVLLIYSASSYSQVGIGTTNPTPAAMLEVSSQTDGTGDYKGFMPPRVPNEEKRDEIPVTVDDDGLVVYVQDIKCLQIYNGTSSSWEVIHCGSLILPGLANDLFISEYVEGDAANKRAVEIANFTGSTKSLDDYEIAIYSNGNFSTSAVIPFTPGATINHGDVYFIKNSTSPIPGGDQVASTLSYNGNDAIVLRLKTGAVIKDVMGSIGSSTYWGQKVVLRKTAGIGPSTTYNPGDYDDFPFDDFTGLGNHTY